MTTDSTASPNEGPDSSATGFDEADIERRLSIVERAIRLQTALGASHLQQVELDPAAFGVPPEARTAVRKLRRERNKALHGVVKQPGGPSQVLEGDRAMTKDNLLGNSIPEHIDANGPLSVDPRIADTADPAEPRGVPQLEVTPDKKDDKKVDASHRAESGADQSADATGDGPGQVGKLPPRTSGAADDAAHDAVHGIMASLRDELPGEEMTDDELVLLLLRGHRALSEQLHGFDASPLRGNAGAKAIKRVLAAAGISIPRKRIQELMRAHAMSC